KWKVDAPEMGAKAGAPIDMESIEVSKFKDGKAVEHWSMMQMSDCMKMMAAMPHPGADMKKGEMPKDTTKHEMAKDTMKHEMK
ncbi:MAG TPA: hypothetical protein VKH37_03320, partial [Ferruginibacter sp.]|nr:hypothetical protein [Ferruginibacter sp.]